MGKKPTKIAYKERLHNLIDIGVALSSEKELNNLVNTVLENSIAITGAESAIVFLTREKAKQEDTNVISLQKESVLHLVKSLSRHSPSFDQQETLAVDSKSVAGYVAFTKQTINIRDCYALKKSAFQFNDSFDRTTDYKTKSMLTLPMMTADGKVRGVLQLINKLSERGLSNLSKTNEFPHANIVSFTQEDEDLMRVFASYAGIALENSQLAESIENLFESFVRASVKAIEARDPTTSGHSDRVAMMTVELALATHKVQEGPFKNVFFSEEQIKEIRYASLLHDFGKIGVTEPVLLKKKKLKDRELESILLRFDTIGYSHETRIWKKLADQLIEHQVTNNPEINPKQSMKMAQQQIDNLKLKVKRMRSDVITANEPQVLSDDFDIDVLIRQIVESNQFFNNSVLTPEEIKTLSIHQGSLTPDERDEIESHVSHTYEFLKQIAWTDNLSHVTTIAHCHHEKLDGSGYPRGIKGESIPIQSRMMTIADIYDALTAFDRPYKKSVSPARALEILIKDARAGKVDGHLLKIFIEAGVFHHATLGTVKKVG